MDDCRIESRDEINAFIQNLNYAIDSGAELYFQKERRIDKTRPIKFTNSYTIEKLFPNEQPTDVLKRELKSLTVEDYIMTIKDVRFPNKSEMRVFGKEYDGEDVYIKIRVEVLDVNGKTTTYVMSFHFAEKTFREEEFPYRKQAGA